MKTRNPAPRRATWREHFLALSRSLEAPGANPFGAVRAGLKSRMRVALPALSSPGRQSAA